MRRIYLLILTGNKQRGHPQQLKPTLWHHLLPQKPIDQAHTHHQRIILQPELIADLDQPADENAPHRVVELGLVGEEVFLAVADGLLLLEGVEDGLLVPGGFGEG